MGFVFVFLERWFGMVKAVLVTPKPNFKNGFQINGTDYSASALNTALAGGGAGVQTGITAFATGGQASATALTGTYCNVTVCATAGDSVKLPTAAAGTEVWVRNSGAATLAVFPFASDSINALAINLSVDIPPLSEVLFKAINNVVWYTTPTVVYLSAPTTQTGGILIKAAASAANYITTIVNASMGQATTLTIPDPGASTAVIPVADSGNGLALKGVTAGTVTASKAVVVNSGKDASSFRNLTCENLNAGSDAVVGTVQIFPTTTASGIFSLGCSNQATNVASYLNLASQAGARTYTLVDAGVSANVSLSKQQTFLTAAGTAYAPSASTEAVMSSGTYTAAGNTIVAGDYIDYQAVVFVGAINATDTFTVRVRMGGIGGTVVGSAVLGVTTQANDYVVLRGRINVRSIVTTTTTMTANYTRGGLEATAAMLTPATLFVGAFTKDTTASITLVVTGQFSTTSVTNSATLQEYDVRQYKS